MSDRPLIAILAQDSSSIALYRDQAQKQGGIALTVALNQPELQDGDVLIVVGPATQSGSTSTPPPALVDALARDIPILGIEWGMQALNAALADNAPAGNNDGRAETKSVPAEAVKTPIFLAPGGKVSHIIGGSGWVSAPIVDCGIGLPQVSARLMASAYTGDGNACALEMPGHRWVIGIGWRLFEDDALPRGLRDILPAFIAHAARRRGLSSFNG